MSDDAIEERDLELATEHPRGTERRTLLRYREALRDPATYARLPQRDRDAIVRWAEIRRRIRERAGIDHDPADLADPLLPAGRLRAHVVEGERIAAELPAFEDPGGDLVQLARRIRLASVGTLGSGDSSS